MNDILNIEICIRKNKKNQKIKKSKCQVSNDFLTSKFKIIISIANLFMPISIFNVEQYHFNLFKNSFEKQNWQISDAFFPISNYKIE